MDKTKKVIRVLAWDNSGSTDSVAHYFDTGLPYIEKFKAGSGDQQDKEVKGQPESIYLLWGTECIQSDHSSLVQICKKHKGTGGGTSPSTIINWLQSHYPSDSTRVDLWLITDGEIYEHELVTCSNLNSTMDYTSIKFIIINQRSINLSVGASFFHGSRIEIYENVQLTKSICTNVPFQYDKIKLENFEETFSELSDYIQVKFMGTDLHGLVEAEKLSSLRARLLKEVRGQEGQDEGAKKKTPFEQLQGMTQKDQILNVLKTLEFYTTLTNSSKLSLSSRIDALISSLINYIHNKHKSYRFQDLKLTFKQQRIPQAPEQPEPDPVIESLPESELVSFYDPVCYEDLDPSLPVLLLEPKDLIHEFWEEGNYNKFRRVVECPLTYPFNPSEWIGHVYSIETFKSLLETSGDYESGYLNNPMTNRRVFGGIVLSSAADKYNDFVLSKTFFRGKRVTPDLALWYYLIWKGSETCEWIEPGVRKSLESYALRRIQNGRSKLGFSSLPLDPKEIVPIPISCLYCTELSSVLFSQDPVLFNQERMRMFGPRAIEDMLRILNKLNYEVNDQFVTGRSKTLQLIDSLKRIPGQIDKTYFLLQRIFKSTPEGFLTFELMDDEEEVKSLSLLKYTHREMIPFDYYVKRPVDLRDLVLVSYQWTPNPDEETYDDEMLCKETCRPYFTLKDPSSSEFTTYYAKVLKSLKEVSLTENGRINSIEPLDKLDQTKVMSCCKYYTDLTRSLKRFPDWTEFLNYTLKKNRFPGRTRIRLFPTCVLEECQVVFKMYSDSGVPIDEFIEKARASVQVESRVKMEHVLESDKILDFVNLAKKCLRAT